LRELFRDILSYYRGIDRKSAWILFYALGAMCVFVAISHQDHRLFREVIGKGLAGSPYFEWYVYTFFHLSVLVFFGLIPMLIVRFVLKQRLSDFGLTLGDWRFGLKFLLVWVVVMAPITYSSSFQAEFQAEYPLVALQGFGIGAICLWFVIYLTYYIGWEFLFRGFMQLGLEKPLGAFYAIMAQTIPSTIIHIGKPLGETTSAVLGGLLFGAVALRSRSILYVLLAHWYIGILNVLFCWINGG